MDQYSVRAITATVGGPSTFSLARDPGNSVLVLSSSALIQRLLLEAFFTAANVEVELVAGSSVVRRVLPFEAGNKPAPFSPHKYRVSRLATQQMPNGQDEHLEVFLVKGEDPEKAYNVYDQLLQQMLEGAFSHSANSPVGVLLGVEFDGNDIATLRLGES
jgi:hypothetical protein